jgi:hypothetical protein
MQYKKEKRVKSVTHKNTAELIAEVVNNNAVYFSDLGGEDFCEDFQNKILTGKSFVEETDTDCNLGKIKALLMLYTEDKGWTALERPLWMFLYHQRQEINKNKNTFDYNDTTEFYDVLRSRAKVGIYPVYIASESHFNNEIFLDSLLKFPYAWAETLTEAEKIVKAQALTCKGTRCRIVTDGTGEAFNVFFGFY